MKLYASEDEAYQIRTGHEIVEAYPELYNQWIIQDIKKKLEVRAKTRPDIAGGRSIEDMFAIATYDYWMYGIDPAEEFSHEQLGASHEKKRQYITFRERLDYIYHLNKKEDMHLLHNKWHTYQLLKDAYRREVLLLESEQDFPAFEAFCQRHPTFVVKPVGLGLSIGIRKISLTPDPSPKERGVDSFSTENSNDKGNHSPRERGRGEALHTLFNQLFAETAAANSHYNSAVDKGVLVEELIEQGEEMAMLHPASVNSVRMLTINLGDGDIRLWYPFIRIGVGGNFLSAAATGSIVAGINVGTGMVETTGFDKLGGITDVHPDTHFTIKGIKIPRWRQLCQKAIEMSERLPTLRYIGWDFVYDKDGEWIVMEGNENAGISSSQLIHHRGMREEFEQLIGYHYTKEYWWQGKYPSRFENIK